MNSILKENGSSSFFMFSNNDGKKWLMPDKNMRIGMNLYQPSSGKGKLMKRFFPYVKKSGLVRSRLGVKRKQYDLNENLKTLLEDLFQTQEPEFSVFFGTPSVHQKIIIQLSRGRKILGYCKITDKPEIKSIFSHEQKVLDELHRKSIKQIPQCLYRGTFTEDIDAFIQSTTKTSSSKTVHDWSQLHWDFLYELHKKTQQKIPFHSSDYFTVLNQLESKMEHLASHMANIISKSINQTRDYYINNFKQPFSVFHADFTPWNMYVEKGKLYVFDWEYAQLTFPPYLDYFHFYTQTAVFVKKWTPEKIHLVFEKQKSALKKRIKNPEIAYLSYLLAIINIYLEREKNLSSEQTNKMLAIWVKIMELLQHETGNQ